MFLSDVITYTTGTPPLTRFFFNTDFFLTRFYLETSKFAEKPYNQISFAFKISNCCSIQTFISHLKSMPTIIDSCPTLYITMELLKKWTLGTEKSHLLVLVLKYSSYSTVFPLKIFSLVQKIVLKEDCLPVLKVS